MTRAEPRAAGPSPRAGLVPRGAPSPGGGEAGALEGGQVPWQGPSLPDDVCTHPSSQWTSGGPALGQPAQKQHNLETLQNELRGNWLHG